MRLAILGDTSCTKKYLVKHALSTGYSVQVLETSLCNERKRKNLSVINCSKQIDNDVNIVMRNVDAVLCILQNHQYSMDDISMKFLENITESMKKNAIRRLIVFSYLHENDTVAIEKRSLNSKWLKLAALLHRRKSSITLEEFLKKTNIDWTIIGHRPISSTVSKDIADTTPKPDEYRINFAKKMISQVTDVSYLNDTLVLPV